MLLLLLLLIMINLVTAADPPIVTFSSLLDHQFSVGIRTIKMLFVSILFVTTFIFVSSLTYLAAIIQLNYVYPPTLPYQTIIQWDDRDETGSPILTLLNWSSSTSIKSSYIYKSHGLRTVNVTISTGSITWFNHTNQHVSLYALNADNSVSKTFSFIIYVDQVKDHCFTFTPTVFWNNVTSSATVGFDVTDPQGIHPTWAIMDTLSSMGHIPSISIFNATQTQPLKPLFRASDMKWWVNVDSFWFTNGPSQVSIEVNSNAANLFGCPLKKVSTFPLSPLLAADAPILQRIAEPVISSVRIPTSPRISQMRTIYHPCRPANGLAIFSPIIPGNPVYLTTNTWISQSIFSLSIILCGGIECPDGFGVFDIQFGSSDILLFATTHGLFKSSTSFHYVVQLKTGISMIDTPSGVLRFAPRGCYEDMVIVRTSVLIYWSMLDDPFNWFSSVPVPIGYNLVNVIHSEIDFPNTAPRILVANAQTNRFELIDAKSGLVLLSSFPDNIPWIPNTEVSIFPHVDGQELYMTTLSNLYRSYDKGYTWHFAYRLPNDLIISKTRVSAVRNAIAILSNLCITFSGRVGTSLEITYIPSAISFDHDHASPLIDLVYDLDGGLFLIMVASDDANNIKIDRIPLGTIESAGIAHGADFELNPGRLIDWQQSSAIALIPFGINTWLLRAVDAVTGIVVPGSWDKTSLGKVLVLHSDRPNRKSMKFLLTQESPDGSEMLADGIGALSLDKPTKSIASASGSRIDIVYEASNNQVDLVLLTNGKYWTTDVIGCTVIINDIASMYMTGLQNLTSARGLLLSSPKSLTTIINLSSGSASISMYDFRSRMSFGMPVTQIIRVTGLSADIGNIVTLESNLSPINYSFESTLKNAYVTFKSGNALLQILALPTVTTATAIVIASMPGMLGSSYNADEIFVFYGNAFIPGILSAYRAWSIYPTECALRQLNSIFYVNNRQLTGKTSISQYLMSTESLSIEYTAIWVPEMVGHTRRGYAMESLYNLITDIDMYQVFDLNTGNDNNVLRPYSRSYVAISGNVSMLAPLLKESKSSGIHSVIKIHPAHDSILCHHTIPHVRVISGCNPQYHLRFKVQGTSTDQVSLLDDILSSDEQKLVYRLPINYRPPSKLGVAVPNSTYIYNADPSSPRYNDFFSVSQKTGVYQQCKDQINREACKCSDIQKRSMNVRDSDCIEKVLRLFQQSTLPVSLYLSQGLSTSTPVTSNIGVIELNNRQDWCVMTVFGVCTYPNWDSVVADPSVNDSISFLGGELYHFRVFTNVGSYCNLSMDIPVYIINSDPLPSVHQSTMTITAVCFCIWLLTIYLWYSFKQS